MDGNFQGKSTSPLFFQNTSSAQSDQVPDFQCVERALDLIFPVLSPAEGGKRAASTGGSCLGGLSLSEPASAATLAGPGQLYNGPPAHSLKVNQEHRSPCHATRDTGNSSEKPPVPLVLLSGPWWFQF